MSKFDKLFEARDTAATELPSIIGENIVKKGKSGKSGETVKIENKKAGSQSVTQPEQKQRGRPKAKRSNPDFIGFTTYIRKDTHTKVKIALLQEGNGRELSELVENLLSGWVENK